MTDSRADNADAGIKQGIFGWLCNIATATRLQMQLFRNLKRSGIVVNCKDVACLMYCLVSDE
jgi:hypothetical protein